MGMADTLIDAIRANMSDARVSVRFNGRDVLDGASDGITTSRADTDMGQASIVEGRVNVKAAQLPAKGYEIGDVVEVRQEGATGWTRAKVSRATRLGGGLMIDLEGVFGE